MSDGTLIVVQYSLLAFNILGTFGNLNIIIATARNKRFHHKFGLVLGFLACCDVTCLWFEFQSFIRLTFSIENVTLKSCFWWNSIYIVVEKMEAFTIMAMALDRQFAISFPMKYRSYSTKNYLIVLLSPGVMFGFMLAIASFIFLDDTTREVCVLPYAIPDPLFGIWNYFNVVCAIITILVYVVTFFELYFYSGLRLDPAQAKNHRIILSTVIVQATVFFFSCFLSALMIMAVRALGCNELAADADTLAVVPGLVSYSCNFYVYFWRSSEYRSVFINQISCGRIQSDSTKASITVAPLSMNQSRSRHG